MRAWLPALALVLSLGGSLPAGADSRVVVTVGPPPPRKEVVDAGPGSGHVWVGGHWRWNGQAFVWVGGRWIAERPGLAWAPGHWRRIRGGWEWVEGRWQTP
jgi:hypothetical protein